MPAPLMGACQLCLFIWRSAMITFEITVAALYRMAHLGATI